jgi:membrane associated rhomboid family serine protease
MEILLGFLLYLIINLLWAGLYTPLPLNDTGSVRYGTLPIATITLIAINTIAFLIWQAPDLVKYVGATNEYDSVQAALSYIEKIGRYGFSSTYIKDGLSIGAFTTFTSMFMHGDFNHLIGNMIFLWAFGRRVEDACGPWRFFLFYLLAGMVANMGYGILTPSDTPGIGASGAIYGVLGAYLILFPAAKVECFWGALVVLRSIYAALMTMLGENIKLFKWRIELPAFLVLVFYIGVNIIPTLRSVDEGELVGGVNYVAHVTGFSSALLIFLFVRKDLFRRYWAGRSL